MGWAISAWPILGCARATRPAAGAPGGCVDVMRLKSEDFLQAFAKFALLARARRRDEDGVVSRNSAYHLGPAGGIDGHRHALSCAHGSFQHGEAGPGGLRGVHELFER